MQGIIDALTAAGFAIAEAAIAAIGTAVVTFICTKRKEISKKIGMQEYNHRLRAANEAWGGVDEFFRITPKVKKTVDSTLEKFTEFMRTKIPGITDKEIADMRATIAAQVNGGRAAIETPALPDAEIAKNGVTVAKIDGAAVASAVNGGPVTPPAQGAE